MGETEDNPVKGKAMSFEETLSLAESLGWIEPEIDVYDHNTADALEAEAIEWISQHTN